MKQKNKKIKKEKSFNAIDVVLEAFSSLKRKRTKAFLGSVFILAVNLLVFGVIYGITNSLTIAGIAVSLSYGIMLVPYINFMCNVAEGRGALEDMFQKEQYTLSNILVGFVYSALILLGAVLFVVPAFVFMALFVFAILIAFNTKTKCFDAFVKAKELSKGFRGRIVCTLLIFALLFALCVLAGVGIAALTLYLIFNMIGWWIVGLLVGTICYLLFFMPYFVLAVVYLYDNTIAEKKENEQKAAEIKEEKTSEEENVEKKDSKDTSNPFDYSDIIKY